MSWTVTCSCGYVSRSFDTRRDAEEDEGEHIRLLTMGVMRNSDERHYTEVKGKPNATRIP